MAFRIHDSVVRGEIDHRVKGFVRGKIWVVGHAEPVTLELRGNAHSDLAGCRLAFTNLQPRIPHHGLDSLNPTQTGQIGDLTASRKVRVMDIPMPEAYLMKKRGEFVPEHLTNCLYLEWFSEQNGRVVIESTDYELEISAPEWRLTPEEDEHDYEQLMKESDARTEKYLELLEKHGDSDEAHEKIEKEMGWHQDEELTPEEQRERAEWIEEMNYACEETLNAPPPEPEPHREGIDWARDKHGHLHHPLQHRCSESLKKFWKLADKLKGKKSEDKDLAQFIGEWMTAGAKLAGALDGLAQDRHAPDAAFTVAYLKRALDHLHKAQAGLEAAAPKKLLPEKAIAEARKELFEIREGILKLMDEFRGRQ